jgi:hypothetical protein
MSSESSKSSKKGSSRKMEIKEIPAKKEGVPAKKVVQAKKTGKKDSVKFVRPPGAIDPEDIHWKCTVCIGHGFMIQNFDFKILDEDGRDFDDFMDVGDQRLYKEHNYDPSGNKSKDTEDLFYLENVIFGSVNEKMLLADGRFTLIPNTSQNPVNKINVFSKVQTFFRNHLLENYITSIYPDSPDEEATEEITDYKKYEKQILERLMGDEEGVYYGTFIFYRYI